MNNLEYINNNKQNLLISFSGLGGELGVPIFEFKKVISRYDFDFIFIKDDTKKWYFGGINSEIDSRKKILEYLRRISSGYKKIITLGSSAGGYAAISFGTDLVADKIITFCPQINMSEKFPDKRWMSEKNKISKINHNEDLCLTKKILSYSKVGSLYIYVSRENKDDMKHIDLISNIKGVNVIYIDSSDHNVAKVMKDRGELYKNIDRIISKEYK